ncbi:MAG: hypothetical protein IJX28_02285 [Clostridia bacterium]|nr:hypothetical protein [Clostridia bacterium]
MSTFSLPAFGETEYTLHRENRTSQVLNLSNVDDSSLESYTTYFEALGFVKKESYQNGLHRFVALQKDSIGIFLNFFSKIRELSVVVEEDCNYFSYTDIPGRARVTPQITQVKLTDYGLSYAIRLGDGRFVVIDGGCNHEPDQERLFQCLKEGSPWECPVIASWIFTHPHSDHYQCFLGFYDRYGEQIKIEKIMLLFPEHDDLEHYPKLQTESTGTEHDISPITNIPMLWERIRASGASVYAPHTGQRYQIGDAACQILASMDDTMHRSQKINAISLVIRMELAGQVILWATDASFDFAKIPEKYDTYLKSDILQIPHHGFQCGAAEAEILGYDLIRPRVCLLPVSDYNAYSMFCIHRDGTRHIMRDCDVDEIITGDRQRTLSLPYAPKPYAKTELQRAAQRGLDVAGAEAWVYTQLNTACPEDFQFRFVNMTNTPTRVWIELFFEEKANRINSIEIELPPLSLSNINITDQAVNRDPGTYNACSLQRRGIPENQPFAVRFLGERPFVVSHKTHTPDYHSTQHL